MRIYISEDASKRLAKAAERRSQSEEDTLAQALHILDEADKRYGARPDCPTPVKKPAS